MRVPRRPSTPTLGPPGRPRRVAVSGSGPVAPRGRARARAVGSLVVVAALALGASGCGSGDPVDAVVNTTGSTATAVGATTSAGGATTGGDGERTTAEGMVLPEYADGRAPAAGDRAPCTTAALIEAVAADIDGGRRAPSFIDCAAGYAVTAIDLGDCPPVDGSATTPKPRCENRKVAYWKSVRGDWRILTYVPEADASCEVARGSGEPRFPRSLCVPR